MGPTSWVSTVDPRISVGVSVGVVSPLSVVSVMASFLVFAVHCTGSVNVLFTVAKVGQ